ncbi:DUF2062 domain-containing protein [Microcoleus sp. FACHB-1515]|uniref:DUF2062 domain-containing protein n=1 Tax=Cyanophyceae TaxID=3028117 RepID=UPI0016826392|nr:DUF2062 domain-containing protein [Microcoleus sp. FACHB-1515]MBD2093194.1 DUF2062 domain-containing protein [Microcoleus sp. FACHB-1515]
MQVRPPTVTPRRRSRRSWQRQFRYFYYRLMRLEGSTEAIARGFAVGVFAGLFPLFGLQTIIGIALAILVRGNKIMAAAGTWISNPITNLPIFFFNFKVGSWLFDANHLSIDFTTLHNWETLSTIGIELIAVWLAGCLLVASISAIISYFLSLRLVHRWRMRRVRRYRVLIGYRQEE